jgi:plasmid stabilization system protein ParE
MRVEVLDEAEQDLVDGARFYEAHEPDLGQYFLDSLFSDVDSLQLYAGIHTVHFGYHRLLSARFPYAVYYRVEGSVARVWAVLDCRQDPEQIVRRLTQGRS